MKKWYYHILFFGAATLISSRTLTNEKLLAAAKSGDNAEISKLHAAGTNVNYQDMHGRTALFYAIEYKHPETAHLLLRLPEIMIHIRDHRGNTALKLATEHRYIDLAVKMVSTLYTLFGEGKQVPQRIERDVHCAFISAAKNNSAKLVRHIFTRFPYLANKLYIDTTPLIQGAKNNNPQVVQVLLSTHYDVHEQPIDWDINTHTKTGKTALTFALIHPHIAKLLLLAGADEKQALGENTSGGQTVASESVQKFLKHWYGTFCADRELHRWNLAYALMEAGTSMSRDTALLIVSFLYPKMQSF